MDSSCAATKSIAALCVDSDDKTVDHEVAARCNDGGSGPCSKASPSINVTEGVDPLVSLISAAGLHQDVIGVSYAVDSVLASSAEGSSGPVAAGLPPAVPSPSPALANAADVPSSLEQQHVLRHRQQAQQAQHAQQARKAQQAQQAQHLQQLHQKGEAMQLKPGAEAKEQTVETFAPTGSSVHHGAIYGDSRPASTIVANTPHAHQGNCFAGGTPC